MGEITQVEQSWIDASAALAVEKIDEALPKLIGGQLDGVPSWLRPLVEAVLQGLISEQRDKIIERIRSELAGLLD